MLIPPGYDQDIDVVAALTRARNISKQLSQLEIRVLVRMKRACDRAQAAQEAARIGDAAAADAEFRTLQKKLRVIELVQHRITLHADQAGRRVAHGLKQVTVRSHKEPRAWLTAPFTTAVAAEAYLSRKLKWLHQGRSPLSRKTLALAQQLLAGKAGQTIQSLWDAARSYESERILGKPDPERHEVVNTLLAYAAELQREVIARKGPLQEEDLHELLLLRPAMLIVAGRRHSTSFDMGFFDRQPSGPQQSEARPTLPLETINALAGKLMKILAAQKDQYEAGADIFTHANQQTIARAIMHGFGATAAARKSMFGHIKTK